MRQDEPLVRGYSVTHPTGEVQLPTQSGWDQVIYAKSGLFEARTSDEAWTVLPNMVLCVGDGTRLRLLTRKPTAVRCLYLRSTLAALPASISVVNVDGLTRELLLHAVESSPLDLDSPVSAALVTLLIDRLSAPPVTSLQLPLPNDDRAQRFAEAVLNSPVNTLNVSVRSSGASRRTIERLFRVETNMTLAEWQRRVRVLAAVEKMATGHSVTSAATAVGYGSPSSFVAAFRSEFGTTPRAFMAR